MSVQQLLDLAGALHGAKVAVVGDLIADRYILGRPSRLSREAPVIVMSYEGEALVPGSAANTVNNLAALGARVFALGAVGQDEAGEKLLATLEAADVDVTGVVQGPFETVTKTRIMAGGLHTVKQQVVRIDREAGFRPGPAEEEALLEAVRRAANRADVLVVSDYGYRTVSDRVRDAVTALSGKVDVLVDSHERLGEFPGAWMVTPNEQEAAAAFGKPLGDGFEAAAFLAKTWNVGNVLLTRGNQGMVLHGPDGTVAIPILGTEEITDVSGAGDTVVAATAAARAVGAPSEACARLANAAASVVVMKRGTATCSAEELRRAIGEGG